MLKPKHQRSTVKHFDLKYSLLKPFCNIIIAMKKKKIMKPTFIFIRIRSKYEDILH